jgi:hypothetical protein
MPIRIVALRQLYACVTALPTRLSHTAAAFSAGVAGFFTPDWLYFSGLLNIF